MNINENSENQGIIVGDNSGTINNGLSVEQAFKIANVLFEANFPSLQEQARIVAKNRADEICLEIFSTLKKMDLIITIVFQIQIFNMRFSKHKKGMPEKEHLN